MNFISIDVETANPDFSSICQIGAVKFKNGAINREWQKLIDPEDFFDPINVSIHGIDENDIKNSPTFPEVYDELKNILDGNIVISHTHFDQTAFTQVIDKYRLQSPNWTWIDSARVARRTWEQFAYRGYGLKNISNYLGIEFQHHNALEDARAAGEIMISAIHDSSLSIEQWIDRQKRPLHGNTYSKISMKGNPNGPLFGEVVVFTGALSIPRKDAAKLASEAGCEVASSLKKTTTLVVVGDQDISKLAGHTKSSKHREAEKRIQNGFPIRIVKESDFKKLINVNY